MNRASIGSDNGPSRIRRQALIETNVGLLSIKPFGINFSDFLIKTQNISFTKMHLNISSAKWWPFWPGGDELKCPFATLNAMPLLSYTYMVSFIDHIFGTRVLITLVRKQRRDWSLNLHNSCILFMNMEHPLQNFHELDHLYLRSGMAREPMGSQVTRILGVTYIIRRLFFHIVYFDKICWISLWFVTNRERDNLTKTILMLKSLCRKMYVLCFAFLFMRLSNWHGQ